MIEAAVTTRVNSAVQSVLTREPVRASGPTVRQPHILIVDDEPSIREFLTFVLEDEGYEVHTAEDGHEALEVARRDAPDVVVTDLMMPRMDGYALIETLRRTFRHVPGIIAMSAVALAGDKPPLADLFLSKPFDVEQVVASLRSLLAARGVR